MVFALRAGVAALMLTAMGSIALANGSDVGDKAPDFTATTTEGKEITMKDFADADVVVVIFTCNECPVAIAYEDRFIEFAKKYEGKNVKLVAINNSTAEDVDDMKQRMEEKGINYTYAYDGSGKSAREFGAKVTPHCFVVNKDRKIAYVGAFDDAWNGQPKTSYVSSVVEALLEGEEPPHSETKAVGCMIKLAR
jgi:peroxiredoxin